MIRGAWGRDPLLPRAFSLMSVAPAGGTADILAKTVGRGTALLERALPGRRGRRARTPRHELPGARGRHRRSAGRGRRRAAAPVHAGRSWRRRSASSARSEMLYGGRGAPDLVLLDEMKAMGVALHLTTEDGSVGTKGLVTRALEARLERHRGTPRARDGLRPERDAVGGGAPRAQARASRASSRSKSRWRAASASASAARFPRARAPTATSAATARCSTPPTSSTSSRSAGPPPPVRSARRERPAVTPRRSSWRSRPAASRSAIRC